MSKHSAYNSYLAQCPFYRGEDCKKIYCDGIDSGTYLQIMFSSSSENHLSVYCRDSWLKCPLARMLWDNEEKRGSG